MIQHQLHPHRGHDYQQAGHAYRQAGLPAACLPARQGEAGFTLVETLVAITLITIAIVAPMGLTVQSLEAAYYARDKITASNLAQEGLEGIRSVRDGNVLATAKGTVTPLFQGILPACSTACYVDATTRPNPTITDCGGACPVLRTNGQLYAYDSSWKSTNFTRTLSGCYIQTDNTCTAVASDEIRLTVVVSWKTSAYKAQQITLSENLYNWVTPGSGT